MYSYTNNKMDYFPALWSYLYNVVTYNVTYNASNLTKPIYNSLNRRAKPNQKVTPDNGLYIWSDSYKPYDCGICDIV